MLKFTLRYDFLASAPNLPRIGISQKKVIPLTPVQEVHAQCAREPRTIARLINVILKGVRLSEKLQLTAALCDEIM